MSYGLLLEAGPTLLDDVLKRSSIVNSRILYVCHFFVQELVEWIPTLLCIELQQVVFWNKISHGLIVVEIPFPPCRWKT